MKTPKNPIAVVLALAVVLVAASVLPAWIRARNTPSRNPCINNLRQLDGAKQQWALENRITSNAAPAMDVIQPYLKNSLACPQGGVYSPGRLDEPPKCSIGGPSHTLSQ